MSEEKKSDEPSYGQIRPLPTIGFDGEDGQLIVAPLKEASGTKHEASTLPVSQGHSPTDVSIPEAHCIL